MSRRPHPTELRAEAVRLRQQGVFLRDIAQQLGVPRSTVAGWFNDPDGTKAVARKERYRERCECGRLMSGSDGRGPNRPKHCPDCANAILTARRRARAHGVAETVCAMWAEGMTMTQIGEAFGWTPKSARSKIIALRTEGYDLPYRRSAEARAKMGNAAAMAHARRVRLEQLKAAA